MKNKFYIYLALALLLAYNTACQQQRNIAPDNTVAVGSNGNSNVVFNSNSNVEMNHMNMGVMKGSMMESSPDATNAPFDLQFLDTMIEHQQGAVDMTKPVAAKSDNAALKAFAAKIIAEQNKEIAQMKAWREKWYSEKPAAINMRMAGMMESMQGMSMKKLEMSSGKMFDSRFLDMMMPHHNGAITMSRDALDRAEHPELKTLANQIIKSQEAEVAKMEEWKTAWSK